MNRELLTWYAENKRTLPWRKNKNPYAIWVSEIMLQQTTVAAVIPYFQRFMEAFPSVEDLAKAKEEKVLGLWSGLGYYSRARNLQRAAKKIMELGKFPKTYLGLLELPGIGPYTAAAIASIAFGEEVPSIDGNVIRVLSRLFDIGEDVGTKTGQDLISEHARTLIKKQPPSEHNQAMMELGATICLPKNPSCLLCPVSSFCKAYSKGTMLSRPVKKKKKSQEAWLWKIFIVENKDRKFALIKNENGTPWLNHLWVLPGEAKKWSKKEKPPFHFKHSITRHNIFVQLLKRNEIQLKNKNNLKWLSLSEIKKVGSSSVVTKALSHWVNL